MKAGASQRAGRLGSKKKKEKVLGDVGEVGEEKRSSPQKGGGGVVEEVPRAGHR